MNIVLLSGGSGKRLWPLSNEVRSKQFLRIVKKGDSGERQSMLERIYDQLECARLADNVTIATSENQRESIKRQLGDKVSVVIEPERRNTFPAIALSCAHLYFNKQCNSDETIIVLPVDPFVEDSFFDTIRQLDTAVSENTSDIILVGAVPTFPSEKYGYIIPVETGDLIKKVSLFKEKPDIAAAEKYIRQGALWNCGVFAFRLGYVMDYLKTCIPFDSYEDVVSRYGELEKTSFDYAVVEACPSVSVIPYGGEWMDIGTWNTLSEVMGAPVSGNVKASGCVNTNIINELDIPVVVMGAKDMVVIAGPDGFLVADKEQSSYIKRHVDHIDQRPMYEEREWGEYKVLDLTAGADGTKALTKSKKIKAGAEMPYQIHKNRSEVWTVLSGKCIITINDRAHEAMAGDSYSIAEGVRHGLKAVTDAEIIEIQVGFELAEDGTETVGN